MGKRFYKMLAMVILMMSTLVFAEDDEMYTRKKEYILLTLGLETDKKLPPLTEDVEFSGSYKAMTKVGIDPITKTLRFRPFKEGDATFVVKDKKTKKVLVEYSLVVKKSRLDAVAHEIQSLLGDIEGIQIKTINNKIIVDGQILLPRDMGRIHAVVSQFGDQAASLVTLSPLAQKKIAEFIARDINNPEVEVRAVNDRILLQGAVNSEDERNRAEVIAKTYLPPIVIDQAVADGKIKERKPANEGVINLISIKPSAPPPPGKMIQIVIHYVELQKDYNKGFKIGWTPMIDDKSGMSFSASSGQSGGVISSITGVINNLLPKLNWAKEHGHARILESTSLIIQDGKKGILNSTQALPYQTVGKDNVIGTSFVDVGIKSAITPVVLGERSDSINLDMDFSLSNYIGQTDGGPQTSKNELNTSLIVRSGQSAAVGGLITNRNVSGYNKMPGKNSGNILISLYASKEFQKQQSQFVVFVTPIIKSSASAGAEKIKKKFKLRD
jgi:pilus assembly protein CpaC